MNTLSPDTDRLAADVLDRLEALLAANLTDQAEADLYVAVVEHLPALVAAARHLAAGTQVYSQYFDLDGQPGFDDTTPEPEDVWRFDRDMSEALGIERTEKSDA